MKKILQLFNGNIAIKAGVWGILGTFLVRGMNLITIPIFSRILSVEEYGDVTLFLTYLSIISVVIGLSLHGSVSRGVLQFKENTKGYISSVMGLSLVSAAGFFLIANLFAPLLTNALGFRQSYLNLLLAYGYATFLINYISAYYIFEFKYKQNILVSFGSVFFSTVLAIIFMYTIFKNDKYAGRILGGALPLLVIAVVLIFYLFYKGRVFYNRKYWQFSLTMSVPLIFHSLANLVLGQSDKVMIKKLRNSYETGLYGLVFNVGHMIATLVEAINNAWIPWLFRKMEAEEYSEIMEKSRYLIYAFNLITIMVITFATEIVKILAPKDYWSGIPTVIPIILSCVFTFFYTLFINIEFYLKNTKFISIGTCMAAVINIILNALTIPVFGYIAAAYSTMISYLLLFIFHYFLSTRMFKEKIYDVKLVFASIIFLCVYAGANLVIMNHLILRILLMIVVFAAVLICNRKRLKLMIKG